MKNIMRILILILLIILMVKTFGAQNKNEVVKEPSENFQSMDHTEHRVTFSTRSDTIKGKEKG